MISEQWGYNTEVQNAIKKINTVHSVKHWYDFIVKYTVLKHKKYRKILLNMRSVANCALDQFQNLIVFNQRSCPFWEKYFQNNENINLVKKTKVVQNLILHLLGSSKYFSIVKYFFYSNFNILKAFFSKRTTSLI